jgi:hypothetical protein
MCFAGISRLSWCELRPACVLQNGVADRQLWPVPRLPTASLIVAKRTLSTSGMGANRTSRELAERRLSAFERTTAKRTLRIDTVMFCRSVEHRRSHEINTLLSIASHRVPICRSGRHCVRPISHGAAARSQAPPNTLRDGLHALCARWRRAARQ